MSSAPKRMVHEYSSLTGLVIREETEADRAMLAEAKAYVERFITNGGWKGWSVLLNRRDYAAVKRLIPRREPPRPGDMVAVDVAWGPYRKGKP